MDYTGIIIQREDGKKVFQLRDNKASIANPNKWALFGGGINKQEEPLHAAIRELKEELKIDIKKEELTLLGVFHDFKKKNYIFMMPIKNNRRLQLQEGAAIGYFTSAEMIWKKQVVFSLRLLLLVYPLIYYVKKERIKIKV